MAEGNPDVTLDTLHGDLTAGFAGVKAEFGDLKDEMRAGFVDLKGEIRDLKATMIKGFAGLPTRESSEEMIRLLRENNRIRGRSDGEATA